MVSPHSIGITVVVIVVHVAARILVEGIVL